MMRSCPEFHFRPTSVTVPTPPSDCCDVVDVCVNQQLVQEITNGKRQQGCGILIRLHWGIKEPDSSFLSTVTPYQRAGEQRKPLASKYAVALTQQSHILQDFTSEILRIYDAKLVSVCYKPLAFTFNHGKEFDTTVFTSSTEQLTGMMKSIIAKCDGTKDLQLSLKVANGAKIDLRQTSLCRCIHDYDKEEQDVPEVEKTDTACQVGVTPRFTKSYSDKECVATGPRFAARLEERFVEMEKKISDHKKMIDLQFTEQRQQNEVLKMHIIRLSSLSQAQGQLSPSSLAPACHPSLDEDLSLDGTLHSHRDMQRAGIASQEDVSRELFAGTVLVLSSQLNPQERHGATEVKNPTDVDTGTETEGVVIEGGFEESLEHDNDRSEKTSTRANGTAIDKDDNLADDADDSIILNVVDEPENENSDDSMTFTFEIGNETIDEKEISGNQLKPTETLTVPLQVEEVERVPSSSSDAVSDDDDDDDDEPFGIQLQRLLNSLTQGNDLTSYRPPSMFEHEHDEEGDFLNHYMQTFGSPGVSDILAQQLGFQDQHVPSDLGLQSLQATSQDFSDFQNEGVNFEVPRKSQTPCPPLRKTRLRDEQDGDQHLHCMLETLVEGTHNKDDLLAGFNEALNQDDSSLPYANSAMDTVFCLDTSASLSGDSLYYMKKIVSDYITGVEDIAERYEIEENLALVTFGEETKILQPLSNDYGNLRDKIEDIEARGHSPMLEGVLTSIVCMTKGGELSIKGRIKLPPRLIIFTDGLATGDKQNKSSDIFDTDVQQKAYLSKAFDQLRRKQPQDYWQGQIVIIPVGRSNMSFLLSLAKNCGGMLIDGTDVVKLCNTQRFHKVAADSLEDLETQVSQNGPGHRRLRLQLGADIPRNEQEQIRDIVEEYKDTLSDFGSISTFSNVQEVHGLPGLGSRVTRGADWKWRNQDTEAVGTIFNHGLDGKYVWVIWDNSHRNVYRWGRDECYDVRVVHDKPREPSQNEEFYIGLQVKRGDGWNVAYGDQNGGADETGVIIRERQDISRVLVKWQNGRLYEYRFGENNVFDVDIIKP